MLFNNLRQAAKEVAEKFESQPELANARSEKYYRHGQIGGFSRNNSAMNSQAGGDSFERIVHWLTHNRSLEPEF